VEILAVLAILAAVLQVQATNLVERDNGHPITAPNDTVTLLSKYIF
jgi:hypothetical protein